jgi:hypothetical protein
MSIPRYLETGGWSWDAYQLSLFLRAKSPSPDFIVRLWYRVSHGSFSPSLFYTGFFSFDNALYCISNSIG